MSEEARWDEKYRGRDTPWDTGRPSTELMRVVRDEKIATGRAIELGCGTGTNAVWLAEQGFEVTAVDFSPLALERAKTRAEVAGVTIQFYLADVLNPSSLGGPYSFFFDRGCYHVVRRIDVGKFLQTIRQLTEPGSRGLVLAGNAKEPHDPGPPVVEEKDIRRELGSVFEIVWLREFRFDQVEEGGLQFLAWSCFLRKNS